MKLPRRLWTVALVVSLLLWAGCAGMWVRGYWAYDAWSLGDADGRTETGLVSSGGRLMAWRVTTPPPDARRHYAGYTTRAGFHHVARRPASVEGHWFGGPRNDWNRAGFGYYARDLRGDWWRCLFLPWWALFLVTALPAATWLGFRLRRRRLVSSNTESPTTESPAPA
jgi:hypothetical protein